jgi:excisionase family DNA binding protein
MKAYPDHIAPDEWNVVAFCICYTINSSILVTFEIQMKSYPPRRESNSETLSEGERTPSFPQTKMSQPSDTKPQLEGLMTKQELAHYCGVTTRCIDNWMSKGLIPYLKISRTVRFRLSNVEAHLDAYCGMVRRRP